MIAPAVRVAFVVHGTPKPQGSKRHVGNGVMVEMGGQPLRTWREDVKQAALEVRQYHGVLDGAIFAHCTFFMPRPKSHFRTGRNAHLLRDGAPQWPVHKPDLDKLLRSTFDAIGSAALWRDDCQVVQVHAALHYATDARPPGARIALEAHDPTGAT